MREGAAQRGEVGRFGETRDREAERVRTESSEERDRGKGEPASLVPRLPSAHRSRLHRPTSSHLCRVSSFSFCCLFKPRLHFIHVSLISFTPLKPPHFRICFKAAHTFWARLSDPVSLDALVRTLVSATWMTDHAHAHDCLGETFLFR